MSFGLGSWGLDVWGVSPELTIESAVAWTTHTVVVTLSRPCMLESVLGEGDGLNPRTWTVRRDDSSYVWTVVGCTKVTDRRIALHLRTPLQSWNREHVVVSTTLRSTASVLVSAPYEVSFRGVLPTTAVNEPAGRFDLMSTDINAGGLRTTEAGAYARVFGDDVIRKMVLRRLTTSPGAYFHIPPAEFGRDLKAKEPLRTSSLLALKTSIEQEIVREPGVVEAKAALSLSNGLLSINVKIQTDSQTFDVGVTAG